MMSEKEKYKEFKKFTTYHDVFSLALALTSLRGFSSDNMDWHRAFYEICQEHGKKITELENILFDNNRPPLPPRALEVYDFLAALKMAEELVSLGFGKDLILHMPDDVKQKIIKNKEEILDRYPEEIKDMAKILEKHLKKGGDR
jgi:hypothetical protein